jgi:hypothetical protein
MFGFNRPKQTPIIEQELNYYSDLDLHHRQLSSNPKLPLNKSYQHTKFGINRSKQTQVNEQKPKVDTRLPTSALKLPVFVKNLVENILYFSIVLVIYRNYLIKMIGDIMDGQRIFYRHIMPQI